jgi:hypothetical protein
LTILFISQRNSSYNSRDLMSLGSGSLNKFAFRLSAVALSLALSSDVFALGLGELRSIPNLGERPRLEVEIVGVGKESLDPACFRLQPPSGNDDLPWLKRATFSIRKGVPPILEIRSDVPLRDPIVQLSIHVACGHELVRNYIILASPEPVVAVVGEPVPSVALAQRDRATFADDLPPRRERVTPRVKPPRREEPLAQPAPAPRAERRVAAGAMSDRLMLSGSGDAGDPSLRLSTEMRPIAGGGKPIGEAQREVLRLEFRTLLALNEQATTQLAAAEKLRNLEAALSELQKRSSEITQKVEQGVVPPAPPTASANPADSAAQPAPPVSQPAVQTAAPVPVKTPAKPVGVRTEESFVSEWGLYGLLLAAMLGVGGWLGWRNYRERQGRADDDELGLIPPSFEVDPQRLDEHEELGGIDLDVDPAVMGAPMHVDFPLDADDNSLAPIDPPKPLPSTNFDSMLSIAAATVDEHFEANPVMELADIMLSFGRVKGAAQALQEYIDHNPEEALQPWIRLMDVYRMAGLREEFDNVARNLNQHFNVEIQQWDPAEPKLNRHTIDMVLDDDDLGQLDPPVPSQPKAVGLEDLPRITQQIVDLWRDGDVAGYMQQLLRDNREGKRAGFPLQVVSDMLFLVELKETLIKTEEMDKKTS